MSQIYSSGRGPPAKEHELQINQGGAAKQSLSTTLTPCVAPQLKRYDSANRLLLTGTPLQNNLMELWLVYPSCLAWLQSMTALALLCRSLLNFLLPAIFNDLEVLC